ncbi:MAG TPA: adenosylcobinamide amidohydrolase [Burkholderiales bacterium]|nr:adenosylcobinamide amidohydrolase [Burkholderiales bacterium]
MSQAYHHAETTDALAASVLTLRPGVLIIDLQQRRRTLSSAPFGGGLVSNRYYAAYTVSNDFYCDDVDTTIRTLLSREGLPSDVTTCVLTAVDVARYRVGDAIEMGVQATVYATVGLGNLSAPGMTPLAPRRPGTINILALVNAELPDAALIEMVQIVTEVKARSIAGHSTTEGFPATGTSTDTVTVALLPGPRQTYAGAVTPVGRALARATDTALEKALSGKTA